MEYYDFSTDTLQDKPRTTVMFSTPFDCALKQEKPFGDWTPQDPLPSFCKAPEMLHSMRFAIYKHDIDLTKWDVSHVEFYYGLFWDTFSKRIDLSTWNVDSSIKTVSSEGSFCCPKLEVLDISSLTNREVLIGWFRKANLPKLQHLFVHDSSMADDVWEILRDAYLNCANTRRQEAGQRGDWEAMRFFAGLMDGDYRFSEITNRIRDDYSPKIKIHIV